MFNAKDPFHMSNSNFKRLSCKAEQILKENIVQKFKKRTLMKGVSEVIEGLSSHKNIKVVFVVGLLDPSYSRALQKAICETNPSLKVIWLHKKYLNLVYDSIKNVSRSELPRIKPRRYFKCRAFAL